MIRAQKNTEDKLDKENLDLSNTEEELDTDENDETEDPSPAQVKKVGTLYGQK